jgi:hypothetical protein
VPPAWRQQPAWPEPVQLWLVPVSPQAQGQVWLRVPGPVWLRVPEQAWQRVPESVSPQARVPELAWKLAQGQGQEQPVSRLGPPVWQARELLPAAHPLAVRAAAESAVSPVRPRAVQIPTPAAA